MKQSDKLHLHRLTEIGCIACRIQGTPGTPAEIHHPRDRAGIPAVLYVGNTLTMEMREEWKTPMHIMHGWDDRLRASNEPVQQINDTTELKQVNIFGEVA